jgi:hypothetical protein
MGLFFDVLSAINNPNQGGSVEQLTGIMNAANQMASASGMDGNAMQGALSGLGSVLRPAMKQQAATGGLESLVGQLAGGALTGGAGGAALQSLLTPQLQQQVVQGLAQKTGLPAGVLQSALPGLVSTAMGFMNMGAPKGGIGTNPLLRAFLDADRDGDADLGDVFKFAGRFLNPTR